MDEEMEIGNLEINDIRPKLSECCLLDLDNLSLCKIISYLDFKELSAFSKTCKSLNVIANDRYAWNKAVLFRRISLLVQDAWFEGWFEGTCKNFKKYPKCVLAELMQDCVKLGQTLSVINLAVVKLVWEENGPFATKLLSKLTTFTVEEVHNQPQGSWFIQRRNFHFKFDAAQLSVQVSVLWDETDDTDNESGPDEDEGEGQNENDDEVGWAPDARPDDEYIKKVIALTKEKFKMKAYLDGECIMIFKTDAYEEPHTIKNHDTEDCPITSDLRSFKVVTDVLAKHLPQTNVPLRPEYIANLFLSLPHKPEYVNVDRLKFVEVEENRKPEGAVFMENLAEKKKLVISEYHAKAMKFLNDDIKEKEFCEELICHLGTLLEKRPAYFTGIDGCFHASAKAGFDLIFANESAIRALLRRISFQDTLCQFDGEEDNSKCIFMVTLPGKRLLKTECTWNSETEPGLASKEMLHFDFCLDGKDILKWKSAALYQPGEDCNKINPITKLFGDCVISDLGRENADELVTNKVTVKFLLALVKGITRACYHQNDVHKQKLMHYFADTSYEGYFYI